MAWNPSEIATFKPLLQTSKLLCSTPSTSTLELFTYTEEKYSANKHEISTPSSSDLSPKGTYM